MTDWSPVYEAALVEEKVKTFYSLTMTLVNQHLPVKVSATRACDKKWMTEGVKRAIRKRAEEFKRHGKSARWKSLRNNVQTSIRHAKNWHYRNFIQTLKQEDPRKWWGAVNRELGRAQERSNSTTIEDVPDHEVAEVLNQYFSSAWCPGTSLHLFPLQCPTPCVDLCSIGEVKTLLKGLNPHKASDPDDLPTWTLKHYADDLAPVITHLFNASYEEGVVPSIWKAANVVPVPKSKGAANASEMRPVSLLPVAAKLMERCILKRLLPSITPAIRNQYAYLKGSSTVLAAIRMVHTWLSALDSRRRAAVLALFADMSKAFDRVNHSILLQRVNDVVTNPRMVAWIQNYLQGRTQRVVANGKVSEWRVLTSGVPQGGVLSPYLFLLFMSTRDVVHSDTLDVGYADDVGLSRSISLEKDRVDNSMREEALQLDSWAECNDMLLNGKKIAADGVSKQQGQSHLFECDFPISADRYVINWMKDGSSVMGYLSGDEQPAFTSGLAGRTDVLFVNNRDLEIMNLRLSDEGEYYCSVNEIGAGAQSGDGSRYQLVVFVPPTISLTGGPYEVEIGETMMSTCRANSHPPSNFTWTLPNGDVSQGAVLEITNMTQADIGTYLCTADNGYATDYKAVDISKKGTY
ncbi:uncharacterized protein LOC118408068 [Branchiostoma floridae]|uniref:Uncharacterized protein LOC118408068 n=1 Tax=Branchiostoma floridae TaxID=7739 RepID=A0A9J7KI84_BRAFL|nr:uncharacterized protein LOC118408068 [Branchiostoma floridae]